MKKEDRLHSYLEHLRKIKEKKSLNQITEAEVLQFVIPTCMTLIEECPTTAVGQQSLVNMICLRSSLRPEHGQIKKKIASFLFAINSYLKEGTDQDAESIQNMRTEIFTTEAIIIKIIQSVIYCSGLFMDNLLFGISRFRGSNAELELHGLSQQIEIGRDFWKQFYLQFLQIPCKEIYETILAEKQFAVKREEHLIVIHFQVSEYLRTDQNKETGVFSRIQKRYNQADTKLGIDCLQALRRSAKRIKRQEIETDEYEDLYTRILAMDSLGQTCINIFQEGQYPQDHKSLANWIFHLEQAEYMILMAKIAMDTIWSELAGIFTYPSQQMQKLHILTRNLAPQAAQRFWSFLFLCEIENQLTQKADEDLNKISLRRRHDRKMPLALLKKILESGIEKELQKQIVSLDVKNKTFYFKPKNHDELQKILTQLPDSELRTLLLQAWDESQFQPDILLVLNLTALARGTTNLSQKITQILNRFGIELGEKQE